MDAWNVASTSLGAAGVILAVFFYLKSRTRRAIAWDSRSFTLLGYGVASLPGFRASFRDRELTSLRATKVLVWNRGNVTVNSEDVASTDHLCIELAEGERILECSLLKSSSQTNQVRTETTEDAPHRVRISFDYLDNTQGFVLSLLHTAEKGGLVGVKGTLKGGTVTKSGSTDRTRSWVLVLGLTAALVTGIVPLLFKSSYSDRLRGASNAIAFLVIAVLMVWHRLPRRLSQTELDRVFDGSFTVK